MGAGMAARGMSELRSVAIDAAGNFPPPAPRPPLVRALARRMAAATAGGAAANVTRRGWGERRGGDRRVSSRTRVAYGGGDGSGRGGERGGILRTCATHALARRMTAAMAVGAAANVAGRTAVADGA